VGDVEMSDDELEKELKQLEEPVNENIAQNIKEKNKTEPEVVKAEIKTELREEAVIKVAPDEQSSRSWCAIYDEVDEQPSSQSYGHHHQRRNNHQRRGPHHQARGSQFDLKKLNKSLHITENCDNMVVGREVAYRLDEEKKLLFGHVVRVLGKKTTSDIFAETKEVVNRGGLKTDRGDRMRTPGGTFLYLMKSRGYATPEQVKEIFKEENERIKKAKKRQRERNFIPPPVGGNNNNDNNDDCSSQSKKKKTEIKKTECDDDKSNKLSGELSGKSSDLANSDVIPPTRKIAPTAMTLKARMAEMADDGVIEDGEID